MSTQWGQASVPMKDSSAVADKVFHVNDPEAIQDASSRLKGILDKKSDKANLKDVAASVQHLSAKEQHQLHDTLSEYSDHFDGTLGKWNMGAYEIELRPDASPYHARAFPIPKAYTDTLKREVERLEKAGVLKRVNRSKWAAPTFIIPKKDGSIRFISDFHKLNKQIK